jgi:hypothetical protein
MTDYRFYSLDEQGRVFAPPTILKCRDDDEALAQGQDLVGEFPIEIWDGDRRVSTLAAEH